MLTIDEFKNLNLEDKNIFNKLYEKYPPIHSDYVFTTMISWKEYAKYKYANFKDHIVILTNIEDKLSIRPPIGKFNEDIFSQILKIAKRIDSDLPIGMIDPRFKDWILNNYPQLKLTPNRDFFDYVYLSSDLANLPGSKYRKIRNRLNKFIKNYKYEIEPISEDNINDIRKFLKRWCLWKDCESDPLLENERKAVMYSISNFFKLGLSGISIIVNGNIEACAVYEQMNQDTIVVHYEKGSPDYDGIYKAINMETAKLVEKDYKYINRESDMGVPGLRKAKESYNPHNMVEINHIKRQDIN
jgi:hypothetical protein